MKTKDINSFRNVFRIEQPSSLTYSAVGPQSLSVCAVDPLKMPTMYTRVGAESRIPSKCLPTVWETYDAEKMVAHVEQLLESIAEENHGRLH